MGGGVGGTAQVFLFYCLLPHPMVAVFLAMLNQKEAEKGSSINVWVSLYKYKEKKIHWIDYLKVIFAKFLY